MKHVYSQNAKGDLKDKLAEVRQLLGSIETELEKYETLQTVHYGHVGDLSRIESILGEAWEFIAETE